MPSERFPSAVIKAMIPYADSPTAHSLDLMLQTQQILSSVEQTVSTLREFRESLSAPPMPEPPIDALYSEDGEEYELAASEVKNTGGMDVEGMIQAVQAVCGPEERKKLDQLLMMMRVRKVVSVSHDQTLMLDAVTSFLGPEQKKQIDELLPLLSLMQEGKMPL